MGIIGATSYGMSGDEIEKWINSWSLLIALAGALVSWPVVYLIYRYAIHVPDSSNDNLPPPPPKF
jgi:hypothetical protein